MQVDVQVRGGRAGRRRRAAAGAAALAALLAGTTGTTAGPAAAAGPSHGRSVVTVDPVDVTPHVMDGAVMSVVQVGRTVYAAGTFTRVRQALDGPDLARRGLVAFDAETGRIDTSFDARLTGPLKSIDTDGTHLFVGGSFGGVDGRTTQRRVAKLTLAGHLAPGQPAVPGSQVNEVVVRGDRVYLGGKFTTVGAHVRKGLAAVSATTGAVLPEVAVPFEGTYNGGGSGIIRMDVAPDGRRLVAVGNFVEVAGAPREQVAVLELPATGAAALSSWGTLRFSHALNPGCSVDHDAWVRDVDFAPDGSYFVVTTSGAFGGGARAGTLCDTVSRWEGRATRGGQQPTWVAYTGGDTVYGVSATGAAVYVGGHFRWFDNPFQGGQAGPGAIPREGLAALDPLNGLPLPWDPGRARGVGAEALHATRTGLWVGSDTTRIGQPWQTRSRIAYLPLAGGTTVPATPASTLPGDVLRVTSTGALQRRALGADGRPAGAASAVPGEGLAWTQVRGAFLVGGTLYYGHTSGRMYARSFDRATGRVGPAHEVDLRTDLDVPSKPAKIPFPLEKLSGASFDPATHRLYYTVPGDARLFYRYFTPLGHVVGAQTFVAEGAPDMTRAAGLLVAGGRLLWGSSADGALRAAPFAAGRVTGPAVVVDADRSWNLRQLLR
ncbi:hypothetical protein D5H78_02740 [Vallicoccus soli]|uniref:Delta-60 repeat domain-containing protein n=1 Tax=Vallicoccus soli TaxID=2339232 RepID=A0A3A3ZML7_9ACTN|nr:hypothetical protein D5H78_02740 [Vallicoccus soli]